MTVMSTLSRVLRRVDTQDPGRCWLWQGATGPTGYGRIRRTNLPSDGMVYVHRVTYEALVGPIPDGLVIDHLCRVRNCVNPKHLEPVTCRENLLRGHTGPAANLAKTECPSGHPYDAANTYHYMGTRQCRACRRRHRQKHKGGGLDPVPRQPVHAASGGRHA